MKSLFDWRFISLFFLITVIQITLFSIVLQNGFTSDDWWLLFDYKVITPSFGFLEKYIQTLQAIGLYHTYQITYIGILESLFKGNYFAYQFTGLILKILATVSLYPLLFVVFKRRLLAFLTTLLYGISYSSAGALLFVCTGSDYLAIFFMNIFLLCYFYSFVSKRRLYFYLAVILLFLSFMSAPIRMYPLLVIVFLIEIFAWIKSGKYSYILKVISRLTWLFLPFFVISRIAPGLTGGQLSSASSVFNFLSFGNYHLLLSPFAGIGYTFLTNDYWSLIFGIANFDNFKNYLSFLFHGPLIIYSVLAIIMGLLISKKPLKHILSIIFANLFFEVSSYFLITNLRGVEGPNIRYFIPVSIHAVFLGFFVVSISISSAVAWLRDYKPRILLLSLFAGPIFSSIFLWGIWMLKGDVLTFKEGVHWYMVTETIGSSLFLATVMVLIFDKIKLIINPNIKYILITSLLFMIIPIYLISNKEIEKTFSGLISTGSKAEDHEYVKSIFLSYMNNFSEEKPVLFYLEPKDERFYPVPFIIGFEETMHFRNWELMNGCVGVIFDRNILEKSIVIKNGIKGFNAASLCLKDYVEVSRPETFFREEDLVALRLKGKEVINIKEEVLKSLHF
ncbi:hypothetical protein A3D83_01230 [Candidatus Daviesbacteria bacterium RIFCSPHIGHO2_02_FULL_41_10]|uniref:Glycosyltransferase RgtA/B/C/D-like domain-containing protein n=1 Tax=Candidatus Daviesbacteria bacterium RIFCSPHIGHO2_02_FULL_41_10 TaxID=1797774 RepID=A0A1F5JY89_9BACT|nr:MAG: hypothetical protein A3D83_01230 [Candidatus Daviesbacteria bacterium RIFCSPHIGHO2_02_FULL_41_10]